MSIAKTPDPPYYAVIFTSLRTDKNDAYSETSDRMLELADKQPGFLGIESVRDGLGITVSYWDSLESIRAWKKHAEHMEAQRQGVSNWYSAYTTRICKVERDYSFSKEK
jgi:heme-degrading monooxygenase HmoA